MVTKFKEAKRIGELGFLKEGKKVDQSESKRVIISKNTKNDHPSSGANKREHLSTIPEIPNKSQHSHLGQHELGGQQEYQRPLAFTDSHFSSYSGTSTPNVIPNQSTSRGPGAEGHMTYPLPVGPLLPGSVTDDGNQKFIQVRIYSRFKNNDLKYTALGREPVSIVHYTMPGSSIKRPSLK